MNAPVNNKFNTYPKIIFVLLLALISPLLLIPLEKVLPYPHIIEELLKAILILKIIRLPNRTTQIKIALCAAFLFALSENIFYLPNFFNEQFLETFAQRFALTTTLHILTALIILLPAQKKQKFIFFSVPFAILVHYIYNQIILTVFR